jgi:hypothetical protein
MEPLDPGLRRDMLPPPAVTQVVPIASPPAPEPVAPVAPAASSAASGVVPQLLPMAKWRILGAGALVTTFALMGLQVQRLIDGASWSNLLMLLSVVTAAATGASILAWTWFATENARRLVGPATNRPLPDPMTAVRTWIVPFVFVGVAIVVVAAIGTSIDTTSDEPVSALPLAVGVLALLVSVPMTYRPLNHLAGVVRQVGGHSARLAQWMWVPIVMALVGIASIVALRFAGVDEAEGAEAFDAAGWAPLWVVAVVAIAPCIIVVLLAWRAASAVEEAIELAGARRWPGAVSRSPVVVREANSRRLRQPPEHAEPISLVPGAELLRLVVVTLLAGIALLSVVGAVLTLMLWVDTRDTGLLPSRLDRTWEALDTLRYATNAVAIALLVAMTLWTFVNVLNVRRTSGRRRNPVIAALAWPAAGAGVWWIAGRMVADETLGRVLAGFAAQAVVLGVPFLLLERSADAVGARRTPLRIVYVLAVLILVHVQGFGGLSDLPSTTTEVGRLAGYLMIGALIQLFSTLAVTEACRALTEACRHEADHHNMLVEQRAARKASTTAGAGR